MHCHHPCWWGHSFKAVSSANLTRGHFELCYLQCDVYSVNRNGANTVPWRAPVLEKITFEILDLLILTYWERLVRYSSVQQISPHGALMSNNVLTMRCGWMVLNAEEKSKNITLAELPNLVRSRWEYRSSSSIRMASSVLRSFWYANCIGSKWGATFNLRSFRTSLSQTFIGTYVRAIGLRSFMQDITGF